MIQLGEEKPPPIIEVVTAVRNADLTRDELAQLVDALQNAPDDATPRSLAGQMPKATAILTAAARVGKDWRLILNTVLTVMMLYVAVVAHQDAEQAHADAAQAHQDAVQARQSAQSSLHLAKTGQITEQQTLEILKQIDQRVGDRR